MQIPVFATREEKAAWWFANYAKVEEDNSKRRIERQVELSKKKNFTLPDRSFRLVYLYDKNKPVCCLVTKLENDKTVNIMQYSISGYNPDDKYDRSIGRTLAIERLITTPSFVKGNFTASELKKALIECLAIGHPINPEISFNFSNVKVPHGIRNAAKSWLKAKENKL